VNSQISSTAYYALCSCIHSFPREDGTVRIWDIRNPLRCLASLDYTNEGSLTSARNVGHTAPVNGLTFTHDGLHLLSTGQDNTLRLWDVYQGTNVWVSWIYSLSSKFYVINLSI